MRIVRAHPVRYFVRAVGRNPVRAYQYALGVISMRIT
jgi:hypothetical protein